MHKFIDANKGATAEVTFMMAGAKEQMVGKLRDVQNDIILLDVDGDLIAGHLDNVLFIKIMSDAENTEHPETATPSGSAKTTEGGQIFSPSINHIGGMTQTILR